MKGGVRVRCIEGGSEGGSATCSNYNILAYILTIQILTNP